MSSSNKKTQVAAAVAASPTPFCKVCHDAKKPIEVYTSHWVRDTPGGKIVCPTLLKITCNYCKEDGHMPSQCSKLAGKYDRNHSKNSLKQQAPAKAQEAPAQQAKSAQQAPANAAPAPKNHFNALSVLIEHEEAVLEKKAQAQVQAQVDEKQRKEQFEQNFPRIGTSVSSTSTSVSTSVSSTSTSTSTSSIFRGYASAAAKMKEVAKTAATAAPAASAAKDIDYSVRIDPTKTTTSWFDD